MSIDFRGIRPASNDPMVQFVVEMQKALAKALTKDQVDQLDDSEDIYSDGQDIDEVIKYHDELSSTHLFHFVKAYYPPFEPDGVLLTCWLRGTALGAHLKDISTKHNDASIYGDPTLVDGSIDLGTYTGTVKSIAMRFNRPTSDFENAEYMQIPNDTTLQTASLSTGFSEFSRFRIYTLQSGTSATIYEKIDDNTPNDGRMLQCPSDGRLRYIVNDGGVTYAKQSATGIITPSTTTGNPYDVFTTYDASSHAIHIYLNGTDLSLVNFADTPNWQGTKTNHDLFLFRRGLGTTGGFVYGDFYDYKLYSEKIVSQTEVTRHYTNKWTISDIEFGHVAIANHSAAYVEPPGEEGVPSFTSASFTSSSFSI